MRILVVETDGLGGLAHWAYQMCNGLADAGADVTLLVSHHYELAHLPHRCKLEMSLPMWPNVASEPAWVMRLPHTVRMLRHNVRRMLRGARLLAVWVLLTRHILRERPDVVQFSMVRFPILAIFLHRLRHAGLKLTLVCHEPFPRDASSLSRALGRAFGGATYRTFSHIYFLGSEVRASFQQSFGNIRCSSSVICPGDGSLFERVGPETGDLRQHYRLPASAPVALFFGGLRRSKGIADLICAFALVVRRVPDARLLVVGYPQAGVDPLEFERQARASGAGDAVVVDPRYVPMEDVGRLMRTADVVVLPYRSATASGVLPTAFAFARPVVVTRVGSIHRSVVEGITGRIVPPDDRAALASALGDLLTERERCRTMGAAARQTVATQDAWLMIARHVLAKTDELLRGNAAGGTPLLAPRVD